MALTIGTDAYWDLTSIRDYWSARGNTAWAVETLPDETAEPLVRLSTDYIDRKFDPKGLATTTTQRLKFPRKDLEINGYEIDRDTIPWQVQEATALVADLLREGTFDALGVLNATDAAVSMEKVDVITIEYDTQRRLLTGSVPSHVIQLLRPLLRSVGGGSLLRA
jgi:hypothetical protein